MSRQDHNAIKKLYRAVYELDKENGFEFPARKPELSDYCYQLRIAIKNAFETADINPIKGHTFDYHPTRKSSNNKDDT